MSNRTLKLPSLEDNQKLHIAKAMAKDQNLAYGLYDESVADKKWEKMSCVNIFDKNINGEILKACWEAEVNAVYCKQYEIMKTGKGELSFIENTILSAMTETELNNTQDESPKDSTNGMTTFEESTDPHSKKRTKIEYQKKGLQMITEGNKTLEKFMYDMISWSNSHNRVLASGFRRTNENLEQLIEQTELLGQRRKKMLSKKAI